jgi:iron-sulfur cluster assembly protein
MSDTLVRPQPAEETVNAIITAPVEPQILDITDEAASQLTKLVAEQETADMALRVFVYPGGCSGMQYGMALEDQIADDDKVVELKGVRLVVDESSIPYILGSEIDYVDSLMGGGFRIYNPNAVSSCSCGHSFDTGSDGSEARSCGSCH